MSRVMRIKLQTLERLSRYGKFGETLDDVINRILDMLEKRSESNLITDKQKAYIAQLAKGVSEKMEVPMETLMRMAEEELGFTIKEDLTDLTKDRASMLIKWLMTHET